MVEGDRREEDLEPLPPLDGDGKDPPEEQGDFGDMLEEEAEDASLDDSTGEDDPPDLKDLDLDPAEGGFLADTAEAHDLDLGDDTTMADFGEEVSLAGEAEEPALGDEDFGLLGDAPEHGGLDAGDEGPLDADEELRDADLPALDADEEGDMDDAALVEPGFASEEPLGLPWTANPWLRVGAPVALVGATAVACAARGALVAGRNDAAAFELVRVDLEGSCERLAAEGLGGAEITSLTVDGALVAAVLLGGRLFLSQDGGALFAPVGEGVVAVDALFARSQLWVRTRAGGLIALQPTLAPGERVPQRGRPVRPGRDRERPALRRCSVPGAVAALTRDASAPSSAESSAVAAVVLDEGARPSMLVRAADDASVRCEPLAAPQASSPVLLAVRGEHMAYAAHPRGIVRRVGLATWSWLPWDRRVTALTFIDDAGTLVVSAYSDADDATALVCIDPAGKSSVVARIGPSPADADSDGRAAALAYDDARGVVWVAGGFGLVAFATR